MSNIKFYDLWLFTALIQFVIIIVNVMAKNWPAVCGGVFGVFMCLIYREELKDKP